MIRRILNNIFSTKNRYKRIFLLIIIDIIIVFFSFLLAFSVQNIDLNNFHQNDSRTKIIYIFGILFCIPFYISTGQYKNFTRYLGIRSSYIIFLRNLLFTFLLFCSNIFIFKINLKFASFIYLWFMLNFLSLSIRFFLRDISSRLFNLNFDPPSKVVIYGAGSAGAQLSSSLKYEQNYKIICFIDDEKNLWGRYLNDTKIHPPSYLEKIQNELDQILFAIPSISKKRFREIVTYTQKYKLKILKVPSLEEIKKGQEKITSLKSINIEDLLGRDVVVPKENLLGPKIKNSIICITGAGGSIGKELSKQIIFLKPKKLILIDHNEYGLYTLIKFIEGLVTENIDIKYLLGNIQDKTFISNTFKEEKVRILFHAAAYKHVPLVENNFMQAIRNNVFSTTSICEAAIDQKLSNVVLISTDKAVRPTNIMGSTKRISELIFQGSNLKVNQKQTIKPSEKTIFSIVRFGNVLGSSGSVIPLFQKQLKKGGPITLTDPNVIRYFMTIKEAVHLVIQTIELSAGGDIFLLEMGPQVKIIDLAKEMIKLNGLTLKDSANPNGDIAIEVIGLRPGEKLYEELLINGDSEITQHPLIYKANETLKNPENLFKMIDELDKSLIEDNKEKALSIVSELVPDWKRYKEKDN